MKKYFIITGASRGLGKAFAEALLDQQHVLFLISRSENPDIRNKALIKNCQVHEISFDLSETEKIDKLMRNLLDHIPPDAATGIYLINNAGITEPVREIHHTAAGEIHRITAVNFTAPVLLTAAFIKYAGDYKTDKRILNITSGAATHPHHGMSMYCATKAALDQFTRSVALEQDQENGVQLHAISPGFVDTDMPNQLIGKPEEEFADAEKFRQAREKGKFAAPDEVAEKIIRLWFENRLAHGRISHIDDF
ncbi:MAG: SDR family NAD(P)-dependent oxidoreductase [Bacteroidales bacterium]